jgi:hypothetical protein
MALPLFITGEPKRNYSFRILLTYPSFIQDLKTSVTEKAATELFKTLANAAVLAYISNLAKSIVLPNDAMDTKQVTIANVKLPVSVGWVADELSVTYLEDELNTVYNFHRIWQNSLKKTDSAEDTSLVDSLSFNPIKKKCLQLTYFSLTKPTRLPYLASDVDVRLPTGASIWPLVYPLKVDRGTFDASQDGLAEVKVQYGRFIQAKVPGTAYVQGVEVYSSS